MARLTAERPPDASGTSSGAARGWAANTFDAFNIPLYRTIWLGTILAFLAFNMAMTAQGVVAYDLTGSNRAVGSVVFGQGVAMLLLNPFGGAIADRFSKRLLILFAQAVIGATMLATAILIATGNISVFLLAVGAFVVGSMFAFLGPTRMSLLGEIVSGERIGNAMALIQVGGNFARIGGPFIAGLLLAWPVIGNAGTYFIIASIFILVIITLYGIPDSPPRANRNQTNVLQDVRSGFVYILEHQRLLHSVVSFHLVTILGLSYIVLMPGFAKDTLDAGTAGLGILFGVAAAGGFVASIAVASLADSKRAPAYMTFSSLGLGVALILAGLAPSFAVAIVVMIFVGANSSAFQTLNNSIALKRSTQEFLGRVTSLMFLAWGLNSLAGLPVGFLADVAGERTVFIGLGASLCAVVVALASWERRILATYPTDA
ncbi:MAG: MFS transporter [Dehalococcoidia bacterium]|nr:MFS transporter [Dehalococcoidia bacterium]